MGKEGELSAQKLEFTRAISKAVHLQAERPGLGEPKIGQGHATLRSDVPPPTLGVKPDCSERLKCRPVLNFPPPEPAVTMGKALYW